MTQHILVVEDEASIAEMLELNLELEGYKVTLVNNGKVALELANSLDRFQAVILDLMLPEVSGMEICRVFRQHSKIPILFLSAKGTTVDRIAGLKLGANDYLAKPFDLEELLLRVNNLLLVHGNTKTREYFDIGGHRIYFGSYNVQNIQTGETTVLSKREIELLDHFIQHKNEVVSRDSLLDSLWRGDQIPTGRTIDNYILNFRKLFEQDPKNPQYFHSIRGVGYKFTID
jgi:two-component system alkaline phosphatase synthesis response regulator PhoP